MSGAPPTLAEARAVRQRALDLDGERRAIEAEILSNLKLLGPVGMTTPLVDGTSAAGGQASAGDSTHTLSYPLLSSPFLPQPRDSRAPTSTSSSSVRPATASFACATTLP
jgi:hypothetical protein